MDLQAWTLRRALTGMIVGAHLGFEFPIYLLLPDALRYISPPRHPSPVVPLLLTITPCILHARGGLTEQGSIAMGRIVSSTPLSLSSAWSLAGTHEDREKRAWKIVIRMGVHIGMERTFFLSCL